MALCVSCVVFHYKSLAEKWQVKNGAKEVVVLWDV